MQARSFLFWQPFLHPMSCPLGSSGPTARHHTSPRQRHGSRLPSKGRDKRPGRAWRPRRAHFPSEGEGPFAVHEPRTRAAYRRTSGSAEAVRPYHQWDGPLARKNPPKGIEMCQIIFHRDQEVDAHARAPGKTGKAGQPALDSRSRTCQPLRRCAFLSFFCSPVCP